MLQLQKLRKPLNKGFRGFHGSYLSHLEKILWVNG